MNDGYIYSEIIGRRGEGRQIEDYLSGRYTHSTLAQWRGHLSAGRVRLDGAVAGAGARLARGQVLAWHRPPWVEPEAPLALPVLYSEGSVLVVHKPAGLPTMPGGGFLQSTLLHQVRLTDPDVSPMHRLGRWTSGAVICARTSASGAHIAAQFASRGIDKRYRALASGVAARARFDVDVAIGPVPYAPLGSLHAATPGGRASLSSVEVLEQRASSFLCDVRIATGRPHQIRIHLAAAGHPLVGDPLYITGGGPNPEGVALPGDPGYRLHAAEVGFEHPETRSRVVVRADPVPGWAAVGELA